MITIPLLNFFAYISMSMAAACCFISGYYLHRKTPQDKRPFVLPITCSITYILLQSSWMLAGWMEAQNTAGVEFAWLLSELKNFAAIVILLLYYGKTRDA